ncbi:MAG: 4Fe-4S dicluster domain-containing protein [Proteobacteria bacterium]|nr:4Fe-4S dicluster domain-containing protein [Pseudomonadota bacterium]
MQVFDLSALDRLVQVLGERGYLVIGPVLRDGAIVYDEITSSRDLPIGWTDLQEGGSYRLHKRADQARFGYVVGPHSWKRYLFPPEVRLWQLRRSRDGYLGSRQSSGQTGDNGQLDAISPATQGDLSPPRQAFIGVRSCELHAIHIQDRVFGAGNGARGAARGTPNWHDPVYARRRHDAFLVSVQCTQAGGTCFCTSMGTGPKAESGFDLALTEVIDGKEHYFAVEAGSDRGREVLEEVPHRAATDTEAEAAARAVARSVDQMDSGVRGRTMETAGIKELLYRNQEHPRWDEVAQRCLACANCTMVCPTCFCSNVEDKSDITGEHAERWRRWDSCFHRDFSYLHGGSVRPSTRARYRQWMTHKLASWIDQFGTSGCVGCGRCITWCPVGIDITEEVAAIRASDAQHREGEKSG